MGSAAGAYATAAIKLGIPIAEYLRRRAAGEAHCTRCQEWHPAEEFAADRYRSREGIGGACRRWKRRAIERAA